MQVTSVLCSVVMHDLGGCGVDHRAGNSRDRCCPGLGQSPCHSSRARAPFPSLGHSRRLGLRARRSRRVGGSTPSHRRMCSAACSGSVGSVALSKPTWPRARSGGASGRHDGILGAADGVGSAALLRRSFLSTPLSLCGSPFQHSTYRPGPGCRAEPRRACACCTRQFTSHYAGRMAAPRVLPAEPWSRHQPFGARPKGILLASQAPRYRALVFDLRRKLGPARGRISLVRGFGYRFDLPAESTTFRGSFADGTQNFE